MFAPDDDEVGVYEDAQRVRPARADGARAPDAAPTRPAPTCGSRSAALGWEADDGGVRVTTDPRHDRGRPAGRLPRRLGAAAARRPRACRCAVSGRWCSGSSRRTTRRRTPSGRQPVFIWERPGIAALRLPGARRPDGGVKVGASPPRRETDPDHARPRRSPRTRSRRSPTTLRPLLPTLPGPVPARGGLHVHDDARPALRDRAGIPSHAQVTRRLRVLRPRLQVRARGRRDPGRPGARRRRPRHPIGLFDPTRFG